MQHRRISGDYFPFGFGVWLKVCVWNWLLFLILRGSLKIFAAYWFFYPRAHPNRLLFHSDSIWSGCWAQTTISNSLWSLVWKATLWRHYDKVEIGSSFSNWLFQDRSIIVVVVVFIIITLFFFFNRELRTTKGTRKRASSFNNVIKCHWQQEFAQTHYWPR